jgi:hypothetical protein
MQQESNGANRIQQVPAPAVLSLNSDYFKQNTPQRKHGVHQLWNAM